MAPNDERDRERVARALSDLWRGGAGPTHYEIGRVFELLDIDDEAAAGPKHERVYTAVMAVDSTNLEPLLLRLLELLEENGSFVPGGQYEVEASALELLRRRLQPFGLTITVAGEVAGGTGLGVDPEVMLSHAVVQEHVRRLQVALAHDDAALLLGTSKELIETTCKFVLGEVDEPVPAKFPGLLSAALEVLGLHPKAAEADDEVAAATRRILGGLQQVGVGVNELRNEYGTGHGRAGGVNLSLRHARLAGGSSIVLVTIMLDTFRDPDAPWAKQRRA